MDEYQIGDLVVFTSQIEHEIKPTWYPPVGTVGKIVDFVGPTGALWVQWPRGTTSLDDKWACPKSCCCLSDKEGAYNA